MLSIGRADVLAFQLTAARRRLVTQLAALLNRNQFQLTAARRRLVASDSYKLAAGRVSTHSRPKAAGLRHALTVSDMMFQLTAARRRLERPSENQTA